MIFEQMRFDLFFESDWNVNSKAFTFIFAKKYQKSSKLFGITENCTKKAFEFRNFSDKTELEKEREGKLFDQWMMMTEERNAILAPAVNSGVPGAPASW